MVKIKIRGLSWASCFVLFLLSVPVVHGQGGRHDAGSASQIGSDLGAVQDRATVAGMKTVPPLIAKWSEREVPPKRKILKIGRLELTLKRDGVRLNSIDTVFARDPANPMGSRPGASATFDLHWRDR